MEADLTYDGVSSFQVIIRFKNWIRMSSEEEWWIDVWKLVWSCEVKICVFMSFDRR